MASLLLDTHALVWALVQPERLSPKARRAIDKGVVAASVINLWELLLKRGRRGALIQDPLEWWAAFVDTRLPVISIQPQHVVEFGKLPGVHGDPFDRMLLAQARAGDFALVSRDGKFSDYGVMTVW